MINNISNFLFLQSSLKGLPKKKRTLYSVIGAQAGEGIAAAVPAAALGKSELSQIRTNEAKAELTAAQVKLKDLAEKSENQGQTLQELWDKLAGVLVATKNEKNISDADFAELTRNISNAVSEQINGLGIEPAEVNGEVILGGAIVEEPDKPVKDITIKEALALVQKIGDDQTNRAFRAIKSLDDTKPDEQAEAAPEPVLGDVAPDANKPRKTKGSSS